MQNFSNKHFRVEFKSNSGLSGTYHFNSDTMVIPEGDDGSGDGDS